MSLESRCLDAFDRGDHEEAVRLLPLVEGPTGISLSGHTSLLHLSSRNGWLDVTKDLITQYRCDPHERGEGGRTCLHYAARHDHVDVLKYLIFERHCDPMATDTMGQTPLHTAAAFSRSVKYLLST
ncbi:PREDICTED: ankyrin repeat-containing protein C6C3.08-like, partial [Amphimedon queenslandica]